MLAKKSKIKHRLEKYCAHNKITYALAETDSTLAYTLSGSNALPATYVYFFNKQDRCEKEETIFSCDSCLQHGMRNSLNNKFVNWNKISPESYYAGFPYNALMEKIKANGVLFCDLPG